LNLKAENISLDIIYEDKEIVIINKDSWINTHPTPWEEWKTWTLVNAILYHIKDLSSINWVERPWIVHRLDKNTSWLIMIAKTDNMMKILQEKIKKREVWKYYLAIVSWIISQKKFKIESYIWRHPTNKIKMTTINPINPKIAITYWEVIKYINNKYSLVKLKLETWRTHQIRVHLASIWYPIIWDEVYWNSKVNKEVATKFSLKRQALHSYKLEIELYWKNKIFYWELKDDMKKILWNLVLEKL
jgi:23S rRNA pseudouridine1911/1915/1917 synthase